MFSQARTVLRVFGFDIRIDPSWLLIAALVTWSLSQHAFPNALPGFAPATYMSMAVVGMLLFFLSLLLHELAHALTARHFGVETRSITLFLFGGVAELSDEPKTAMNEFWIAIAGPLLSLALSFFFWVFASIGALIFGTGPVVEVLGYLALVNFVLAIFNLLPAFPLDGGRILRAWLWHRSGDVLDATETAARAGMFLAYALMLMGVLALFQGALVAGFWQLLLGTFVLAAARASVENQRAKSLLGARLVNDLMTKDPVVVDPRTSLAALVNQDMLGNRISFVPVVENGTLLGYIDTELIGKIDRENWTNTQVDDVFAGLSESATVPSSTPVLELFDLIAKTGRRKFMVVDEGHLVGVITLSDLSRFLELVVSLGRFAKPPHHTNHRPHTAH